MAKSIDDILREMEEKRVADAALRQENERKILEMKEVARKDYVQRMRMYESFNNTSPLSVGYGGGIKSYVTFGYVSLGYIGNG